MARRLRCENRPWLRALDPPANNSPAISFSNGHPACRLELPQPRCRVQTLATSLTIRPPRPVAWSHIGAGGTRTPAPVHVNPLPGFSRLGSPQNHRHAVLQAAIRAAPVLCHSDGTPFQERRWSRRPGVSFVPKPGVRLTKCTARHRPITALHDRASGWSGLLGKRTFAADFRAC